MHQQSIVRASNSIASAPISAFHGGRRTLATVVTVLGMIAAALVAAFWMQVKPIHVEHRSRPMQFLAAYLDGVPCDREKVVALGEQYLQSAQYEALFNKASRFSKTCGSYPRLQWQVYEAHRRLGQWKDAAAVATGLIDTDPHDKDYWWWRGLAYERQGDLEQAAHDYREALARMPWLDHIPFNLANVLEELDRPCEAIVPLKQFIAAHPTEQRTVQARIDRLRRQGRGCSQAAQGRGLRRAR